MNQKRSIFFPIYLSMGVLGLSLGLTLPLLSLSMTAVGATASIVGTSTMLQAVASLIASLASPAVIFRVGNKRLLVWSLLLCAITMGFYAMASDITSFFIYRILNGFSLGFIFVATESTLIAESDTHTRARVMGIYLMFLSAGAAAGPLVGFPLFALKGYLPYIASAGASIVAFGFVARFVPSVRVPPRPSGGSFPIVRIAVPLGSALLFGFMLEGIMALIALYLKGIGLSAFQMGAVVTSFDLGGILLLYPLTKVADVTGKMRFIAMATFGCGILFALTPVFPYFVVLLLLTFVGGGTVNAIYPVGMAVVGDELSESHYPRAAALLSAAFYIGGIFGPLVLSRSMDRFGYDFLFYTAAAVTFLYAGVPLYQVIRGRR